MELADACSNRRREFADVIERALYNGINSGMSLDGTLYCYRNPLAFDPSGRDKIRNAWYDTTCCPPNLERTFASLPGYFYSTSSDGIYLHLYDNSELDWHLENGRTESHAENKLSVGRRSGNYCFTRTANRTSFFISASRDGQIAKVAVNGKAPTAESRDSICQFAAVVSGRCHSSANGNAAVQVLQANPQVADDSGRVAAQRGPLVYCLEELDQPEGVKMSDLAVEFGKRPQAQFQSELKNDLLGGVVVLHHNGVAYERASSANALYARYDGDAARTRKVPLTFIPYYAWSNRQQTSMQVWTPMLKA